MPPWSNTVRRAQLQIFLFTSSVISLTSVKLNTFCLLNFVNSSRLSSLGRVTGTFWATATFQNNFVPFNTVETVETVETVTTVLRLRRKKVRAELQWSVVAGGGTGPEVEENLLKDFVPVEI